MVIKKKKSFKKSPTRRKSKTPTRRKMPTIKPESVDKFIKRTLIPGLIAFVTGIYVGEAYQPRKLMSSQY